MFLTLLLASQMLGAGHAALDSTTTFATYLASRDKTHATRAADPLRFLLTCDYVYGDVHGNVGRRERIAGVYVHSAARDSARWEGVTRAVASGLDAPFANPTPDSLLGPLAYRASDRRATLQPGFFGTLPPTAIQERNLVWDTVMFEGFASEHNTQLRLGIPLHVPSGNVGLAGAGNFKNRDIVLAWTGVTMERGRECGLVTYEAFFNTLDVTAPGMHLNGRSHYWGTMWIARDDGRILRATLFEDVLGQLETKANPDGLLVSIFRDATFDRLETRK